MQRRAEPATPRAKKSKHRFAYEPVTALGVPGGMRGNFGVRKANGRPDPESEMLQKRTVDRCVCSRCGTAAWTNEPTQARAMANSAEIDCDTALVEAVHSR